LFSKIPQIRRTNAKAPREIAIIRFVSRGKASLFFDAAEATFEKKNPLRTVNEIIDFLNMLYSVRNYEKGINHK
jgi:hypothetical protein